MELIWEKGTVLPTFGELIGDYTTDVLVIGGGMAGLLCAWMLKEAGADCVVAEAGRICGGVTRGTSAKITVQHGLLYHKIAADRGWKCAADYLRANKLALEEFARLCGGMDCGFQRQNSYVYTMEDRKLLDEELCALERLRCPAELELKPDLPFQTAGALRVPDQAQFHPLRFAARIAPELRIFEGTAVRKLEGCTAQTDGGTIRAKRVVFCCHFPFVDRRGAYFMKMYQHRSYVLALEGARLPNGMYVDEKKDGLSFRHMGNYLLLGGGDHRTGSKGGGWTELRRVARRYYPGSREVAHWAAQDCITLDGAPYIGRYSPATPDWYVATGFNKWGMTGSMAAALLLRDMLTGEAPDWAEAFDPARPMKPLPLAANLLTAAGHLLTPSLRRCTHLGCALKWNRAEHSWDCPCHGSRFGTDGAVLNGPADRDWNGVPEE